MRSAGGPRLPSMARISVVICCADAADTLPQACRSARWADELVVVDSGSTDATPQIAQELADRYVMEPWRGYTHQKQFGAGLCRNDWVFVLDGDEQISPSLADELTRLSDEQLDRYDVMMVRRRNYVMGRPVRAWWPDWQSRLIHRHRCRWPHEALHEARLPSDPSRQGTLRGWIDHKRYSSAGFGDYFSGARMDERLLMVARQMHDRGKRCRWWDLALRPWISFWKFYILKRSFLDGTFGLLIAQKAAVSTQLKYAALWAVQAGASPEPQGKGSDDQGGPNEGAPPHRCRDARPAEPIMIQCEEMYRAIKALTRKPIAGKRLFRVKSLDTRSCQFYSCLRVAGFHHWEVICG